jgi:hypothetical protein
MIGAVIRRHRLAQAARAVPPRAPRSRGGSPTGFARVLVLLIVAAIVFSPIAGNVAAESTTFAGLFGSSANVHVPRQDGVVNQATGGFVSGTVWDDTKIRNGNIDDNEPGLAGVTIIVERVDIPSGPLACTTGVGGNINPTDASGRYRCEGLAPGEYRVTVTIPAEYEATTARQRQVTVTTTQGGTANFGLGHLDTRIRTIGGIVFLDCNENGIQDLQVEFDRRPSTGDYEITLERIDGRNALTPTTNRQNRFSFDNLDSGTYLVALRISDARLRATTTTRREVTIGTTFGANVDFGVFDTSGNSDCARAANQTATVVLGTATAQANRTATVVDATSQAVVATAISRGGGATGPNGQPLPPATASAVAAAATGTAARFTAVPTATAIPTATPIPTARLERAYPRSARFLMQAIARYPDGRRIDMLAEGALIGLETIIFQDSGQRVGSEQLSMRIKRNERVDDIVVTAQDAYRQRDTDDFWRAVAYDEVRNELGLLAPLDAIVALRCIARGQEGGRLSWTAPSRTTSSAKWTRSASGRPASGRSTAAVAAAARRRSPPSPAAVA